MLAESFEEQLSRIQQMANDGGDTWDLSDNDRAALRALYIRYHQLAYVGRKIQCSYCGEIMEFASLEEKVSEAAQRRVADHTLACPQRPEAQLVDQVFELCEILKTLEWVRVRSGGKAASPWVDVCPDCNAKKPGPHATTCKVGPWIARYDATINAARNEGSGPAADLSTLRGTDQ